MLVDTEDRLFDTIKSVHRFHTWNLKVKTDNQHC